MSHTSPQRVAARHSSKTASLKSFGYIAGYAGYAGYDTNWGADLTAFLDLSTMKVQVVVREWMPSAGMDSQNISDARTTKQLSDVSVPALDLKKVMDAIKDGLRKSDWFDGVRLLDFRWIPAFGTEIKGLKAENCSKTINSYFMDRNAWKAKWDHPVVKPTGGPFSFGPGTTLDKIAQAFTDQGFPASVYVANEWNYDTKTYGEVEKMVWFAGTKTIKSLAKLLESSADSVRKGRNDDGWDAFYYKFGSAEYVLTKMRGRRSEYNWAFAKA